MAQVPMTDAVFGGVASSSANNAMIDNIQDHETRMLVMEAWDAGTRLGAIETLVNNGVSGNTALNARVNTLEASSGGPAPYCHVIQSTTGQSITGTAHSAQTWDTITLDTGVDSLSGLFFDNGLDSIIFPPGTEGIYLVTYMVSLNSVNTHRGLRLQIFNGTTYVTVDDSAVYTPHTTGSFPTIKNTMLVKVPALAGAVYNRIRMQVWAAVTSTVTIGGGATQPLQRPVLQALYQRPVT